MTQGDENRFVNLWLKNVLKPDQQFPRMRVGKMESFTGVERGFPDKIAVKDGVVYIIEAKLDLDHESVAQIKRYDKLFPSTPEFQHLANIPRKLILLMPAEINVIRKEAEENGVEFIVFPEEEFVNIYNERRGIE